MGNSLTIGTSGECTNNAGQRSICSLALWPESRLIRLGSVSRRGTTIGAVNIFHGTHAAEFQRYQLVYWTSEQVTIAGTDDSSAGLTMKAPRK